MSTMSKRLVRIIWHLIQGKKLFCYKTGINVFVTEILLTVLAVLSSADGSCKESLYGCKRMVKPFLYDLRYMFPTSIKDVEDMCKLWSRFVDCVRTYMSECTNRLVKSKFNAAVGDTVRTVHAICSSNKYQRDYLDHAVCFKRVAAANCGSYYRRMVEQVTNSKAEKNHICCTFSHFQQCVNDPLLHQCGKHAHELMAHSMTYLISHCGNAFYPLHYKCPKADPENLLYQTSTDKVTASRYHATTTSSTWLPRTVIYTLSPTHSSRTSVGDSVKPASALFILLVSYVSYIFRGR